MERRLVTERPVVAMERRLVTERPVVAMERRLVTERPVVAMERRLVTERPVVAMERRLVTERPAAMERPLVTLVAVVTPPHRAVRRARGSEAGRDRREWTLNFPLEALERFGS
jgi:hypothetical protein